LAESPTTKRANLPNDRGIPDSNLTNAMSVIMVARQPIAGRAQASQRRNLVAMHDLNLGPASVPQDARNAGDTSQYPPHGEAVTTPRSSALPRTGTCAIAGDARSTSARHGDPPAAMRYTEARMAAAAPRCSAEEQARDGGLRAPIRETARSGRSARVGSPTCSRTEPRASRRAWPRAGIPPHNHREILRRLGAVIDNPKITSKR